MCIINSGTKHCMALVLYLFHENDIIYIDELEKLKQAARIEAYSSYSEFVRRTALLEASHILASQNSKENNNEGE